MGMSLNRVQLIGNLTRDPEVRQIPGGQVVATFSVATSYSWKDQNGQKKEKAEFHNIVAWRKLAEICGQYLRKGSKVFVEGRLQSRDWEGKDGVKRSKVEIVLDNMVMLGAKGASSGSPSGSPFSAAAGGSAASERAHRSVSENAEAMDEESAPLPQEEVSIDDLPF